MTNNPTTPEAAVRVMQLLAGGLVSGVVIFAVIAVFALGALDRPPREGPVSFFAAAFTVVAFLLHLVLPRVLINRMPPPAGIADEMHWYGLYQGKLILGMGLLEGAAFMNIIVVLVEHNWWSPAIAGVLVGWMLAQFPTQTRVRHWVELQRGAS